MLRLRWGIPFVIFMLAFGLVVVNIGFCRKTIHSPIAEYPFEKPGEKQTSLINNRMMIYTNLKNRDPQKARKYLENIIQSFPNFIPARMELAHQLEIEQAPTLALQEYAKILAVDPNHLQALLKIAEIKAYLGDYEGALLIYQKLYRSPNKKISEEAEHGIGNIKNQQDNFNERMNTFYFLKKKQPLAAFALLQPLANELTLNPLVQKEMGLLWLSAKNFKKALFYFEYAQKLEPNNLNTTLQLGYIYYDLGDYARALTIFRITAKAKDSAIQQASLAMINKIEFGEPQSQPPVMIGMELNVLLNQYYATKKTNLLAAKSLIEKILVKYPENLLSRKEYAYLLLQLKLPNEALQQFLIVHKLAPSEEKITLQIAYLYEQLKNPAKAKEFFSLLINAKDPKIRQIAIASLTLGKVTNTADKSTTQAISKMDMFYKLKKTNPLKALVLISQIVEDDPDNAQTQAEMAYLLMTLKNKREALTHFVASYALNPSNFQLANQIGFIYDGLGQKKQALRYFRLAKKSTDIKINRTANIALINLSGWSLKILPLPVFVEYYAEPLYLSRFDDYIVNSQYRAGFFIGAHRQLQLYGSYRENWDTRSLSGIAPQIYSDNYRIHAIGGRYYPFSNIGLFIYLEYGNAYDSVYQNRPRWRQDLRTGVVAGRYWGAGPNYSRNPVLEFKLQGDFYGDFSYYSRYRNSIGQFRVRQGARIFRWKNAEIQAYLKGQYFVDTQQQFYNNVVEYGFGLAFKPFNQISLTLRAEHLFGHYIPVDSPSPNPYGSNYQTNIILAEVYFLI